MSDSYRQLSNSDFESYAKCLGLTGADADVFYEAYYGIDAGEYEFELVFDESVEY